jgi:hypothetical protein
MRRPVLSGRRGGFAAIAILGFAFAHSDDAVAAPTKVMVFGTQPNAATEIRKNSTLMTTTTSSPLGSVVFNVDAALGDVFDIIGPDLQPPVPPLVGSLVTHAPGCVTVSWLPSGDPTVVGYTVSFGTASVAGGAAPRYDRTVVVGAGSSHTECSLPPATYFFAVQARNADGVLSAYSTERSITIQTVAVLISMFEASVTAEGVQLVWRVEADEVVQGYRVYRSEAGAPERRLTDELLPNTASSFVDADTRSATSYTYVLTALNENGDEVRSAPASVTLPALDLALGQNYPNPFNPSTKIPFTLAAAGHVLVRVFDVSGASVATVFEGTLGEGRHVVEWSGRDDDGTPVASGIYLYSLTTGKQALSKKMVMVK